MRGCTEEGGGSRARREKEKCHKAWHGHQPFIVCVLSRKGGEKTQPLDYDFKSRGSQSHSFHQAAACRKLVCSSHSH